MYLKIVSYGCLLDSSKPDHEVSTIVGPFESRKELLNFSGRFYQKLIISDENLQNLALVQIDELTSGGKTIDPAYFDGLLKIEWDAVSHAWRESEFELIK